MAKQAKKTGSVADLAERIRRDRLNRIMTWSDYAAWMGFPLATIHKIVKGKTTRPHELTVDRIERKLAEPVPTVPTAQGPTIEA